MRPNTAMHPVLRLGAGLLVLLTSACVAPAPQQVITHVARFVDLPDGLAGRTAAIVPLAHQNQSAEFNQYRGEIETRLRAQGMQITRTQSDADFLVTFDYAIGAHDESRVVEEYGTLVPGQTITTTDLFYNAATGQYEPYQVSEYIPAVQGVTGYHTVTETIFDRRLGLRMFDLARSSGDDLYPAYEATVTSSGVTPSFAGVSACLFNALFSNFLLPGTQDTTEPSETCQR